MRNMIGLLIAAGAVIAGAAAGMTAFFDGMETWKIAVLFCGFAGLVLGVMVLCLRFFVRVVEARMGGPRAQSAGMAPWDDSPAQIGDYRPPAQLPAPARVVTVPRYTVDGVTRPWQAPAPKVELQTMTDDGDTLTIPLRFLYRFAALDSPSRAQWTGKATVYGECRQFFQSHGLLDQAGHWREEYSPTLRRQWLAQFEAGNR